jgi:hypothetical protein
MSNFQPGDKVLVNGTTVAEIEYYDEDTNVVRFVEKSASGATNTHTAHISQTKIQNLVTEAVGTDVEESSEKSDDDEESE